MSLSVALVSLKVYCIMKKRFYFMTNDVIFAAKCNDMSKRFYFETEETKTVKKKGWVEIDTDFTQVYDCFKVIGNEIDSVITFKLLFWLLSEEVNKSNGFSTGFETYTRFNKYLKTPIHERTFKRSIAELESIKAITKITRGHYYFSPYVFWRNDKNERLEFIEAENKEQRFISHNPLLIDNTQK